MVSQENVNIEDFTGPRAVPFLKKAMKSELIGSVLSVEEVVDQSMADSIQQYLQKHCEASLEIYEGSKSSSVHYLTTAFADIGLLQATAFLF